MSAWNGRDPLPRDPLPVLAGWLEEAFAARAQPNPHAIALATVDADGRPSVRMVLCQRIDTTRGEFVFYTDRTSRKGRALEADARAALVFYWGPQNRQARVEGAVAATSDRDGDAYFEGRPRESKVSAWASDQSQPVASRDALHERVAGAVDRFSRIEAVPRPPKWGGYALRAESVELWISGPARIHDRALWVRDGSRGWRAARLQP